MARLTSELILSLIDRVTAPARGVGRAIEGMQSRLDANNARMDQMRGRMVETAAVGYMLARAIGAPISAAADLEASMNRVEAALSPTSEEFAKLGALAKDMGRTTKYSVNESALAIEMLAKNGLDAASILGGALKTSMDVASSSGADLSVAADITTDIMANFKLRADEMSEAANGIAGVLIQSKFGIDDYRLALGQAGGVAGGMGVTLDDFNTTIAATSSTFASGSDAGTSFKTFLSRLVPASDSAAGSMNKLGLEFFDANGNMKNMAEISQELKDGLEGLSDEARNEHLGNIFGQDAIRTAISLGQTGSKAFLDLQAIIKNTSAAKQAEARMKGFWGTVERLKSAIDLLATVIGEALLPALTATVDKLIPIVDKMIAFAEANPKLTGTIVGVTAALVGLRVAAFAAQFAFLWMKGAALMSMIGGLKLLRIATLALGGVFTALALAGLWIYNNWENVSAAFDGFRKSFEKAIKPVEKTLEPVIELFGDLYEFVSDLVGPIDGATRAFANFGSRLGATVGNAVRRVVETFRDLPRTISDALTFDNIADLGSRVAGWLRGALNHAWNGVQIAWDWAAKVVGNVDWPAVGDGIVGALKAGLGAAWARLTFAFDWASKVTSDVDWPAVGRSVVDGLQAGLKAAWSGLQIAFDWAAKVGQSLAGSDFAQAIRTKFDAIDWATVLSGVGSGIGSAIAASWRMSFAALDMAGDLMSWLATQVRSIDATTLGAEIANALIGGVQAAFGMIGSAFSAMSDGGVGSSIGAAVIAGITSGLSGGGSLIAAIMRGWFNFTVGFWGPVLQSSVDAIKSIFASIDLAEIGRQIMASLLAGLKAGAVAVLEYIRSVGAQIKAAVSGATAVGNATINADPLKAYTGPAFGNGVAVDGARAAGGPVVGGKTYLVGERGPELFTPPRSGNIIPNGGSSGMGGGGGGVAWRGDLHVHAAPGMDEQTLTDLVMARLGDALRSGRDGLHADLSHAGF